ncbi:MAG: hypothetical protein RL885_01740 [Planctomycetota bacterium]
MMAIQNTVRLASMLLAMTGWAAAGTLHVDANYPGCPGTGVPGDSFCLIQDAINVASNGDVILVRPGTYFESSDYLGKTIEVRSTLGATMTRIQGNPGGAVVSIIISGEGPQTLLQGFEITGGRSGIVILGSSPRIRLNWIHGNSPS